MKITVKAIRDTDGEVLGETIFDVQDKDGRAHAVTDLVNRIYSAAMDPLNPPSFKLSFDSAK